MTRLVLHIGDCKSGSTAIQSVLAAGSYTISGGTPVRLKYATAGRPEALNHHRLSNSLHMDQARQFRDRAWGRLGDEFRSNDSDILVVSSERFEFTAPGDVRAALEQFLPESLDTLEIVAYVRPHAARLLSGYAQNIKQGLFNGELPEFLEQVQKEKRFDYADRLISWRDTFGADRVSVRPMIRSDLQGQCVVHDFLTACVAGTGNTVKVEKIPDANSSLGAEALALMREVTRRLREQNPAQNQQRANMLQRFAHNLETSGKFVSDALQLDPALAAQVRDIYGADADRCDAEFFGGPVLRNALDKAVAQAQEPVTPPDPHVVDRMTELTLIWVDMMGNAMRQMAQNQRQGGGGQGGGKGGGGPRQVARQH
ncbi:hypothetical protein GLS40_05535 [Pseudooceanicola sp. 216_PA32_1]|uniref:Sulfotransferase family protein n=1 Tax=Pseudooceanicola pacificus TaxID=2676438 RepID=A0A844WCY1_9RHOB|nr:hypothetical protein [Pseudooceanicola pacificus]MWB77480.1 hypothetical protein [Pseudooceanicola pacificus]